MLASLLRACAIFLLLSPALAAEQHCLVLQYTLVSDSAPGIVSAPPDLFQAHLEHLHANDYTVLPLDRVVEDLLSGLGFPPRCVALTVDAPVQAVFDEIRPRVARFGFPVTLFVSPALIDSGAPGLLTWEQLRTLRDAGFGIQNHGLGLPLMARRNSEDTHDDWQQRIAFEIQLAQGRIEQEIGHRPTLFAYPFGEYNADLKAIVASMDLAAFGQQAGAIWSQSDPALLPRLRIAGLAATMPAFRNRLKTRPLGILGAFPAEPVVPLDQWQPSLTLVLPPGIATREDLDCRLNGAPGLRLQWLDQPEHGLMLTPLDPLQEGVNRIDCLLPDADGSGIARYSHLWLRRRADGSWPVQTARKALYANVPSLRPPGSPRDRPGVSATP
jgi:poly-beta-1,6-N-acetyl-D-glucosamine N-deacetylase